jgi:RNA polymerase sigma-70 factor (ECF subfamily)
LEDLEDIVVKCAAGDSKAQETLYYLFASKMFGVCLRYAKDYNEAEDNLQDGFVKVFTNIKNFRHEGSLEGWIRRIMVNVSLEKFRKQRSLFPVEDVGVFEAFQYTEEILDLITSEELLSLVQQLPPRYKMVFNLFVIEGYSHQQVSEAMGIDVGTSKSDLARARKILKRKVNKLYNEIGKKQIIGYETQ